MSLDTLEDDACVKIIGEDYVVFMGTDQRMIAVSIGRLILHLE